MAAGALAVGAGLLWLQEQLARRHLRGSIFLNDYQQDALYMRPNYRGMTSGQIQQSRQLLDTVGEEAYLLQPGGIYLERRELDREMLRRAGGGGFIFVGPGISAEPDLTGWTAGAAAAALGVAAQLWNTGISAGRTLADWGSQLWGLLNRPPALVIPPSWSEVGQITKTWDAPGTVTANWVIEEDWIYDTTCGQTSFGPLGRTETRTGSDTHSGVDAIRWVENSGTPLIGCVGPVFPAMVGHYEYRQNGVWQQRSIWVWTGGNSGSPSRQLRGSGFWRMFFASVNYNATPATPPPVPGTTPAPGRQAFASIAPVDQMPPAPLPEPATAPPVAVVLGDPVQQPAAPGGTPAATPALSPVAAPSLPRPVAIPGAVPTTNDGSIPAPTPAPAQVTPGTQIIPWPGAAPVNAKPLAPPATLEGIAQKTGEIEGKVDQLGGMLQPKTPDIDWGSVLQAAGAFINWLQTADPEGGYSISSPCEQQAGSPADPLQVPWDATIGPDARILKRLDALAELLQHHKNLKQPSCKNPSPVGEVVTVQFEET